MSSFDHIHNDFYENSKMRESDIDINLWKANITKDNLRRKNMLLSMIEGKDVLDFGCGKGGFLFCAKPHVNSISGIELDRAIQRELRSDGYEVWETLEECDKKFDIITMFHVIEHLEKPVDILKKIKGKLKDNGTIVIETPNANDALLSLYKSKEFADYTYWSPHIYLYSQSNLIALAEKSDLNTVWVKQIQRYPLANHLYWLTEGKPGGQNAWPFMNSQTLIEEYEEVLRANLMCDTLMMCFS